MLPLCLRSRVLVVLSLAGLAGGGCGGDDGAAGDGGPVAADGAAASPDAAASDAAMADGASAATDAPAGADAAASPDAAGTSGSRGPLGMQAGVTGTVNGVTYTFTAGVTWGQLGGVGSIGAFLPTANGFDPLSRWLIRNVPATVGVHQCGGVAMQPDIAVTMSGGASYSSSPLDHACTIEILSVSGNSVDGRFSGMLAGGLDGKPVMITDGYFYKPAP